MGRSGRRMNCPTTGKTQFRSYKRAAKTAGRIDSEARIYRCSDCGRWHMTSFDQASYDRRQAELRSGWQADTFPDAASEVSDAP